MINPAPPHAVQSSVPVATGSYSISLDDQAHVMDILRNQLYSDKILAVIREYSANAWDANREAGRGDVPIRVHLPSPEEPWFEVDDDGPGLSLDDMFNVFPSYGRSTKRGSNTAVGMLGIGSKSAFSYTDSFVVVSRHGGMMRQYSSVLDESNRGELRLLQEQEWAGGDGRAPTGLTVKIAVRHQDVFEFNAKAGGCYRNFYPYPANNRGWKAPDEDRAASYMTPTELGWLTNGKGWTAVMGCVSYPVKLEELPGVASFVKELGGVLRFNIGELQVSASREGLKYSDQTRAVLLRRIEDVVDHHVRELVREVEANGKTSWERRLLGRGLQKFRLAYLTVYADLMVDEVQLNLPDGWKLTTLGFRTGKKAGSTKKRLEETSVIKVRPDARIVLRDDARSIQHLSLGPFDYVLYPPKDTVDFGVVQSILLAHKLNGIPDSRTSLLDYHPPVREHSAGGRDSRHRARMFEIDYSTGHFSKRYSSNWTVARRTPTADDVYVIMERFRCGDFYGQYRRDHKLAFRFGMPMPVVYGYKTTDRKPRTEAPGITYWTWSKDLVRRIFDSSPMAASLVRTAATAASLEGDAFPELPLLRIETELGPEHLLARFYRDTWRAKNEVDGWDDQTKTHAKILAEAAPEVLMAARERARDIASRYPLLGAQSDGYGVFWGAHDAEWLRYIKDRDADVARKTHNTSEDREGTP